MSNQTDQISSQNSHLNSIDKISSPSHDELNPQKLTSDESNKDINEHEGMQIGKIHTVDDFIIIGRQKFYRDELMQAFGGTLNPERYSKPPTRNLGNPVPLGLCAFALTTFLLSMFNARAMGITTPNVVVGSAFFYGGICQFLAGVWDIALGNVFGGTALTSYGAFWASYAAINVKNFTIASAYTDPIELENAVGFFLLGWAIFTFMLVLCTTKSTYAFSGLFVTLFLTFLLLSIGSFTRKVGVTRAGGVMGVITSLFGWYNAYAGIANPTNSYIHVTPWYIPVRKP